MNDEQRDGMTSLRGDVLAECMHALWVTGETNFYKVRA